MINTFYNDVRLPPEQQKRRLETVMQYELTPLQRLILTEIYVEGKSQSEIAQERGVCRSTISRTLHRAETRLRRFLRY